MSKLKQFLLLLITACVSLPTIAFADVAGLVPCSESTVFTKRLDASVRKLETRIKKFEVGSPPALSLENQINQTKQRFDRYSKSGLLCGKDGLPHLIADGRWSHSAEFVIPGIMFLYITGWIGWVGRKYIGTVSNSSNATEKEIILDVPLALKIMTTGFIWPVSAWQEYVGGKLLAPASEITISPR